MRNVRTFSLSCMFVARLPRHCEHLAASKKASQSVLVLAVQQNTRAVLSRPSKLTAVVQVNDD